MKVDIDHEKFKTALDRLEKNTQHIEHDFVRTEINQSIAEIKHQLNSNFNDCPECGWISTYITNHGDTVCPVCSTIKE